MVSGFDNASLSHFSWGIPAAWCTICTWTAAYFSFFGGTRQRLKVTSSPSFGTQSPSILQLKRSANNFFNYQKKCLLCSNNYLSIQEHCPKCNLEKHYGNFPLQRLQTRCWIFCTQTHDRPPLALCTQRTRQLTQRHCSRGYGLGPCRHAVTPPHQQFFWLCQLPAGPSNVNGPRCSASSYDR